MATAIKLTQKVRDPSNSDNWLTVWKVDSDNNFYFSNGDETIKSKHLSQEICKVENKTLKLLTTEN